MTIGLGRQQKILESLQRFTRSGLSLTRALEVLRDEAPAGAERSHLAALLESVSSGKPLSASTPALTKLFGPSVAVLLQAGERAGSLEKTLQAGVAHVELKKSVGRKAALALVYPVLLAGAACVLLPVPTLWTQGFGVAFLRYYLPFGVVAAVVVAAGLYVRSAWLGDGPGRRTLEGIVLRLPLARGIFRDFAGSLFFSSLASLLEAGTSLASAFTLSCEASGSRVLADGAPDCARTIEAGSPLSKALEGTGFFHREVLSQVRVAEETGDLAGTCQVLAEACAKDVGRKGTLAAVALGAVLAGVVGLVLALHIIGFWVSYFNRGVDAGLY